MCHVYRVAEQTVNCCLSTSPKLTTALVPPCKAVTVPSAPLPVELTREKPEPQSVAV